MNPYIQKKSRLIGYIVSTLKFTAKQQDKPFNEGDTFLALCFKTDNELARIASLCDGRSEE